jgi:hypothetical protein
MSQSDPAAVSTASVEDIQREWRELKLRVEQLEAEKTALDREHKALRLLLERVIEHRQKSHSELVLLMTGLVSRLPLNDIGVIVSRLVEHNTNTSQYLASLTKGTIDSELPQPTILKTLDQTKRELAAAMKPLVEELVQLDTPFETELLQSLLTQPDLFYAPKMVRANRCFIKGLVSRERIVRDFGPEALVFFNDLTTDPKLNPHPKAEEIVLGFRNDFESVFQQNPTLLPQRRDDLRALYHRIQRSKAPTEQARAQRSAFQRLSFLIELLYYYEHQNTEAPDVLFAQRLPGLVEQLVLIGPGEMLDEKLILLAESLISHVIGFDHRQMIINNIGKGGGPGTHLRYVLRLRAEKVLDLHEVVVEFVRHLIPPPPQAVAPQTIAALLRLIPSERQRLVVKAIMVSDRIRKEEAEGLGKAVAGELGLTGIIEQLKAEAALTPEVERQVAWSRIKEMITRRTDAAAVAAIIRERLNAKYDADEIRQSWITLTEAEPLALIRIFCHLPYLPNGKTDPIARTVIETYVTRLTHEKYAATYQKVVKSLKNMFHAKPDSPTLLTFIGLVKWADPEGAQKLSHDVGMPLQ